MKRRSLFRLSGLLVSAMFLPLSALGVDAIVAARVASGTAAVQSPVPSATFTVDILLSCRLAGEDPVGQYSMRFNYDAASLSFGGAQDRQFGAFPMVAGSEGSKVVDAFNPTSLLVNGALCRASFTILSATSDTTVILTDNGATPLSTTTFQAIAHSLDSDLTAPPPSCPFPTGVDDTSLYE